MDISIIHAHSSLYIITGSNGLIGSSITEAIRQRLISLHPNISLGYCKVFKKVLHNNLARTIEQIIRTSVDTNISRYQIILAHGSGGFFLDPSSANSQYDEYKDILALISRINDPRLRLFLISSLGALSSKLHSSYRDLVFAKESSLKDSSIPSSIIRLPSIWGIRSSDNCPKGLISHLLNSCFLQQESKIFGSLYTIRNYLSSNSIADKISNLVIVSRNESQPNIVNLRSCFYHSINGILSEVRKAVPGCKLMYRLEEANALCSEDHTHAPNDGVVWIVNNCLSAELKEAWRQLKLN